MPDVFIMEIHPRNENETSLRDETEHSQGTGGLQIEGPGSLRTHSQPTAVILDPVQSSTASSEMLGSHPEQDNVAHTTTWQGWAEIENDPAIFNTLLREWGVQGLVVQEVVALDAVLETPPDSLIGLIFLSRYKASEEADETHPEAIPADLWFANQTSSFSCGTVALINIINNCNAPNLGVQLDEFRQATLEMSSKDRGLALDGCDHIRDIHNSFARKLDMMQVDLRLKEEAVEAAKSKEPRRRKSKRRKKNTHYVQADEEDGFHFIAYLPKCGQVWELDGLKRVPRSLGLALL